MDNESNSEEDVFTEEPEGNDTQDSDEDESKPADEMSLNQILFQMNTTLKNVNKEQSSIKRQMKGPNQKIDKIEKNQNKTNTDINKKIDKNHTEVVSNIRSIGTRIDNLEAKLTKKGRNEKRA